MIIQELNNSAHTVNEIPKAKKYRQALAKGSYHI